MPFTNLLFGGTPVGVVVWSRYLVDALSHPVFAVKFSGFIVGFAVLQHEVRRDIGELVTKYFPEVLHFEPGTKAENTVTFEPLEAFLSTLSADSELIKQLREKSNNNASTIKK